MRDRSEANRSRSARRWRWSLVMVLLAWPGPAAADPEGAPRAPASRSASLKLPAWYSPLFREGATWQYRVTQTNEWDEAAARSAGRVDADGKVDREEHFPYDASCTTSKLTRFKRGLAVKLDCSFDTKRMKELVGPHLIGPPLDGVYLATARGLWRAGRFPENDKELDAGTRGRPLLPAQPARWSYRKKDGLLLVEKSLTPKPLTVLGKRRPAWCAYEHTHEGDGCDSTACFVEGTGIATAQARSLASLVYSSDAVLVREAQPPPFRRCVLHAGGSETGTCWFNAECGAPGSRMPGDGLIDLTCSGRRCTCERQHAGWPKEKTSFVLDTECEDPDVACQLLVKRCMPEVRLEEGCQSSHGNQRIK